MCWNLEHDPEELPELTVQDGYVHKQKKTRKSKGKGASGLVISEAHSTRLALRQVFPIYIVCMED